MLTREYNPNRYRVRSSELFEKAFSKHCVPFPRCEDVYSDLIWRLEHKPKETGTLCHQFTDGDRVFYTTVTPPLSGMPPFYVLYELDEANRVVTLWNVIKMPETPMIL